MKNWNTLKELGNILSQYNNVENWPTSKNNHSALTIADWAPKIDIRENKEAYIIDAELPGVKKENVNITLDNGVLTIDGEKQFQKENEDEKSHRIERTYGCFRRSFSLPELVNEDAVVAKFKEGILSLMIPKAQEQKRKSIAIQVE